MVEQTASRAERHKFDVSAAADRVVPLAETDAMYFQTAIADDRSALVVAFCELPSVEVRQVLTDAAGGVPLQLRIVRHSWATLRAVMDRISAETELWDHEAIQLSQWGPGWATNRVEVHLVHYTPEAAAQILGKYGSDFVEVLPADTPFVTPC